MLIKHTDRLGLYANFQNDIMEVVEYTCPITGIIDISLVPKSLDKSLIPANCDHFLADYKRAKELLYKANLNDLPNEYLAGLVLVIYGYYDLLTGHDDKAVSNIILAGCKKETLVNALVYSKQLTHKIVQKLPQLDIDYNTHKDSIKTFNPVLANYINLIKTEYENNKIAIATANDAGIISIRGMYNPPVLAKNQIPSTTKSDYYKQDMHKFNSQKPKAKEAFRILKPYLLDRNLNKLTAFLSSSLVGDNMIAVEKDIKAKIILRMNELAEVLPIELALLPKEIINYVEYSNISEHINAQAPKLMERASDSFPAPRPSFAELVAKAKAKQAQGE